LKLYYWVLEFSIALAATTKGSCVTSETKYSIGVSRS